MYKIVCDFCKSENVTQMKLLHNDTEFQIVNMVSPDWFLKTKGKGGGGYILDLCDSCKIKIMDSLKIDKNELPQKQSIPEEKDNKVFREITNLKAKETELEFRKRLYDNCKLKDDNELCTSIEKCKLCDVYITIRDMKKKVGVRK